MDKHNEVFRNKVISNWKLRSQPPEEVEIPSKLQLEQQKNPPKRKTVDLPAQKRPESPPNPPKRVYTVAQAPPSPVTAPKDSEAKKTRTEPQTLKNKKRKLKKKNRLKEQQPKRAKSITFTYQPNSDKSAC